MPIRLGRLMVAVVHNFDMGVIVVTGQDTVFEDVVKETGGTTVVVATTNIDVVFTMSGDGDNSNSEESEETEDSGELHG